MDSWWVPCRRADCAIHNVEVTTPEHLSSPLAPRHPALEAHSTAPRPHVPVPGGAAAASVTTTAASVTTTAAGVTKVG